MRVAGLRKIAKVSKLFKRKPPKVAMGMSPRKLLDFYKFTLGLR